jgi:sialate O-acetylesterase
MKSQTRILEGLSDGQVLQRNSHDQSETLVRLQAANDGVLYVTVAKKHGMVAGFKYHRMKNVIKGINSFWLKGIPVGGPYRITFELAVHGNTESQKSVVENVFVGDVWILAGQSNMEGYGKLIDAARSHSKVRAFYMDDKWQIAKDPIHNVSHAIAKVHQVIGKKQNFVKPASLGTGPGVSFGISMYRCTGVPQGLIACARGGTHMAEWSPVLKRKGENSLYGAMYKRFVMNGSKIAGVVWYQGCGETLSDNDTRKYTQRMKKFIATLRNDLNDPNLPIVIAQIGRCVRCLTCDEPNCRPMMRNWNKIQEQQRTLAASFHKLAIVPTIDLTLDDTIHISGKDQQRLGSRFAQAMAALKRLRGSSKLPIELGTTIKKIHEDNGNLNVVIYFKNVYGKLKSSGRPTGFTLLHKDGSVCPSVFDIQLETNKVLLRTGLKSLKDGYLQYGMGMASYCNIIDDGDRSLPCFKCKF